MTAAATIASHKMKSHADGKAYCRIEKYGFWFSCQDLMIMSTLYIWYSIH